MYEFWILETKLTVRDIDVPVRTRSRQCIKIFVYLQLPAKLHNMIYL